MDVIQLRHRLMIQQNTKTPIIGDIWVRATKTANKTLYTDGNIISENGMVVTEDYIEIVPETGYTMTVTAGTTGSRTRRIMCYDSNKEFISQLKSWNWMNIDQTVSDTVTMPSNAKYVRMCAFNLDTVSVIGLTP